MIMLEINKKMAHIKYNISPVVLIITVSLTLAAVSVSLADQRDRTFVFKEVSSGLAGVSGKKTDSPDMLAPVTVNGAGSGFIIDRQGHVLTLSSIIVDSNNIEVTLEGGESWPAGIVGTDRLTDITVLRIQAPDNVLKKLAPLKLNRGEKPQPGESVFAAGRHVDGSALFTSGIVSCPERSISSSGKIYDSVIQVDMNMLPSMAGAPLFNGRGTVLGMLFPVTVPASSRAVTAFALSSGTLRWISGQIVERGIVERAWLGASFSAITSSIAKALGLPSMYGLMVTDVVQSGPAARAGIMPCSKNIRIGNRTFPINGDLIVAVNKKEVHSYVDLKKILQSTPPGKTILLSLYRGKIFRKIRVKTGVLGPDGQGRIN